MIYLLKSKFNTRFFICLGFVFLFTLINFISLKNYYDEMFSHFILENDHFEDNLRKENSNTNKSDENNDLTVQESDEPKNLKLNSLSALLMDGENNRVLYEVNGYQEMPMASTTKIMTCIIALEQGNLDDVVTVSSYAARMPDVQLTIRAGEQYYLRDLMYSLMLESHNDVAVAIAEHVGGNVEGFATMMNDKARALECNNTNFVTPNGLDAEGHYTTARDLAIISSYAIQNKDFIAITNTSSHQFKELKNGRSFSVSNKNKFLYMMDGAIGIKTGFTSKAGYCFVGAVKRLDRTLISVVLGCGWPPSKSLKWTDTKRLMTYGIDNYEKKQIFEKIELDPVYVDKGQTSHIGLALEGDLNLLLRKDEKVIIKYSIPNILLAPLEEGKEVGSAKYYIDDCLYADIPIYTTDECKKIDYKFCFMRILKLWGLQY
ncbi:MAG: D-alanyl-D-alanine carboxypeptidase [Anaerolineaceae bacterium]|nr:MAG: D-alanyl-D-alanine carboxypeptidase [Anaerolineaceae bacterium]